MHRHLGFFFLVASLAAGCSDDSAADPDAGPPPEMDGGTGDAGEGDAGTDRPAFCNPRDIRWLSERVEVVVGNTRAARITLSRDFCEDLEIGLAADDASIASFPASVTIEEGRSRVEVDFSGDAVGTTTVTASYTDRVTEETFESEIEIVVTDDSVPDCTGTASGRLEPGDELRLSGDLDNVGVAIPEGASRDDEYHVDPFDASLGCAEDQLVDGYHAIGPAIEVGPVHARFTRELPITIPVKLSLLPEEGNRGHIQFTYTGAGVTEPRVVAVASPDYETHPGFVTFYAPRLGRYQAVLRDTLGEEREREFTYRGITGISMGSAGAALIGMHNPERFDFIGPLGGPVDWIHLLDYLRTYHTGGFCTEEERVADPEACAMGASIERTPDRELLHQVRQDFEHWYYVDEWTGHGGTFDRDEYIRIFRDLAMMYGNPNTTRTVTPGEANITPPGVPDTERMRSNDERCSDPVRIPPFDPEDSEGTGFFDDEYNPEGQHPVITFCDGGELPDEDKPRGRDIGVWDPEQPQNDPIEVALAVDVNDNGIRDRGEPVIRQGRENFADCGLDQLCNPDEEGYDPVTNPDPAGDDYDFQYNPNGTEANWLRDYAGDEATEDCDSPEPDAAPGIGELFDDFGLDAIEGTAQLDEGGFDTGEGDGCWTLSRGTRHMYENNARGFALEMDDETLQDLDFFSDGGIRDLFNFATNQDQLAGAFSARGFPLQLYNSHAAFNYDGRSGDDEFRFASIDWRETGKFVHLRFGNVDATEGAIVQGDGQHVGTPTQVINRILAVMGWMSARWPGGDRTRVVDRICATETPACPADRLNQFTIDFTSPTTGRTGPASIVLPPGYYDEEYADESYPVVYLLHGYGQEPQDLVATGLIIWTFMTANTIPEADRLQKMIFVFPDGRCRDVPGGGRECVKGTFYANAPDSTPQGAQMETWVLDLMDYMDENFRTKAPETHTVFE